MKNVIKTAYIGNCRRGYQMDLPCNWVNLEGRCGADTRPCQVTVTNSRQVKVQEE